MIFQDTPLWVFLGEIRGHRTFKSLFNRIQVEIDHLIIRIRSDRGREFDSMDVDFFCELKGIKQEFSFPRTPQHNGVVERKNKVL